MGTDECLLCWATVDGVSGGVGDEFSASRCSHSLFAVESCV